MIVAVVLLVVLMTGCIMIDMDLQMPNEAVQPTLHGSDCVPIILGFGIGTIHLQQALVSEKRFADPTRGSVRGPRIRKIHSLQMTDVAGLGFGERCLKVTGEP